MICVDLNVLITCELGKFYIFSIYGYEPKDQCLTFLLRIIMFELYTTIFQCVFTFILLIELVYHLKGKLENLDFNDMGLLIDILANLDHFTKIIIFKHICALLKIQYEVMTIIFS